MEISLCPAGATHTHFLLLLRLNMNKEALRLTVFVYGLQTLYKPKGTTCHC